ncbi:MAG: hypothetical protein CME64_06205 [Halobacteriovoraceae bacterium]|nr:hypothetical protein [Halobacteriovoraceae bacterium]|tara:strand:- start:106324 stop:107202 length:879 start_codon:yes stop_codon:yes gene_type:complete
MLDKFEKLENSLNKILSALGGQLKKLWFFIVPSIIFVKLKALKLSVKNGIQKFKERTRAKTQKGASVGGKGIAKINEFLDKCKNYPAKEKSIENALKLKDFLLKTPFKNHADAISKFVAKQVEKVAVVLKKLTSTQALIAEAALMMIMLGTYGVYVSSEKIYKKEYATRAPASQEEYLYRPDYLKYEKRTLKVFNVKVPIFVESLKAVSSVTVDFTVRTDTRFAKTYLQEYEYKLIDHFFMTTQPVISSFPLQHEGKSILKQKIKDELNIFLDKNNVEGDVKEVEIIFIVGS